MPEPYLDLSTRPLLVAGAIKALYPESGGGSTVAQWIEERREYIGLIYFHNLAPSEYQAMLVERDLPRPDAVISDEGASVQVGGRLVHASRIEEDLVAGWPGCPAVLATLRPELAEIGMTPMRGGGAHCLKLEPTMGKSGFEGVEDLRTLARTVGARVRLRDEHIELVPRGSNPAAALLRLLPCLGVDLRRAKSRLLVVPNTNLQSNMMYLGFRSVVTTSSRPETFRRATTAPRAFVSSTPADRGFFTGLTHHFGWDRETRLRAAAA